MSTATVISRALQERLDSARQLTDSIFSLLKPEALYSRPIPERHRLIFYLGHLEAFDWNLICRKTLGVASFSPEFDTLFEFGIDPPVGQAASDQPSDWPSVEEIQAYNRRVRARIDELLDQAPEQIVHVALEHRLMHAETWRICCTICLMTKRCRSARRWLHSTKPICRKSDDRNRARRGDPGQEARRIRLG